MPADRAYDLRTFASLYNRGAIVLFDTLDTQALRTLRTFIVNFPGELSSLPDSKSIHFFIRDTPFTPTEYFRIKNFCRTRRIRIISFHCPFGSGKKSNPRTSRPNDALVLFDPTWAHTSPRGSFYNPIDLTEETGDSASNPIILD